MEYLTKQTIIETVHVKIVVSSILMEIKEKLLEVPQMMPLMKMSMKNLTHQYLLVKLQSPTTIVDSLSVMKRRI